MDCVSIFPQYERVRNYIDFIHGKKMEELSKKISNKTKKDSKGLHKQDEEEEHRNSKKVQLEMLRNLNI